MENKMIGFYDYTVIATYIGFAFAVSGIRCAYNGNILMAVVCLMGAGFCDAFDGKIARTKKNRNEQQKKFGIQIDSLSDMVCFGVLPAMIGCALCDGEGLFVPIMVFYALTALIRLAYFNVSEEERQSKTDEVRKYYLGLPVTASCLLVPLLFAVSPFCGDDFQMIYGIGLAIIGILHISPMKIRKPGGKILPILACIGLAIAATLILEYNAGLLIF